MMFQKYQIINEDTVLAVAGKSKLISPMLATVGLVNGTAGLLVFYYYMYWKAKDPLYLEMINGDLSEIVESIGKENAIISYYPSDYSFGLPGIGMVVNFLRANGIFKKKEFDEILHVINEIICDETLVLLDAGKLNFFHGATGCLYYLYDSLGEHDTRLSFLEERFLSVIESADLASFFLFEGGQLNHYTTTGITGFLLVVVDIYQKSTDKESILKILENGYDILKEHIYESLLAASNKDSLIDRLSYSKGYLMICVFMYRFARLKGADGLMGEVSKLTKALDVDLYNIAISDLSFGNGLTGISQIYKTLSILSSEKRFTENYNIIQGEMLKSAKAKTWKLTSEDASLYNGPTAMLLAIASAKSEEGSGWRKLFLL